MVCMFSETVPVLLLIKLTEPINVLLISCRTLLLFSPAGQCSPFLDLQISLFSSCICTFKRDFYWPPINSHWFISRSLDLQRLIEIPRVKHLSHAKIDCDYLQHGELLEHPHATAMSVPFGRFLIEILLHLIHLGSLQTPFESLVDVVPR